MFVKPAAAHGILIVTFLCHVQSAEKQTASKQLIPILWVVIMAKDKMRQVGEKVRAERMVSEYIRSVGDERTEVATIFTDPDTGKKKIISKAEALARDIWKMAMECEDTKLKFEYRKLLLDRIEGRPGAVAAEGPQRPGIPDKVSEKGKQRLNQMVGGEDESI